MEQSKPIPEDIFSLIKNEANERHYCGGDLADSYIYEAVAANEAFKEGADFMYHRMAEEAEALKAALIDIRDNGGGKLCREDRGRMQAIAAKALEQYSSPKATDNG